MKQEITILHVILVAVVCITSLLITALMKGIDGVLLASGIASLVGLVTGYGGYKLGQKSKLKE